MNKLRVEASNRGLAVEFIEEIWTLMIKNFIKYEEKIFDEIWTEIESKRSANMTPKIN